MGGGGLLDALTKRVMERALEGELTDHLGYEKTRERGPQRRQLAQRPYAEASEDGHVGVRDRGASGPRFNVRPSLKELYKVEVSPSLISAVTDAVLEDVKAWQSRPLDTVYPIVYLDAIHVKVRSRGHVRTHAVYLALALTLEGNKELTS